MAKKLHVLPTLYEVLIRENNLLFVLYTEE